MRGQSSIEFFITVIVFLVVIFSLSDMLKISYTWLGIQYASNRAARAGKMLPNNSSHSTTDYRATAIRNEIVRATEALNIHLVSEDITVQTNGNTIEVNTHKVVTLGPVVGLLLKMAGDHSGTYHINVREVIRNAAYF